MHHPHLPLNGPAMACASRCRPPTPQPGSVPELHAAPGLRLRAAPPRSDEAWGLETPLPVGERTVALVPLHFERRTLDGGPEPLNC